MNREALTDALRSLTSDLRARRLLPIVAVLLAALIALPILLSRSGSASPVPSAGILPAVTTPSVTTGHAGQSSTVASNYLNGPSHDPFVQPSTQSTASNPSSAHPATGAAVTLPAAATAAKATATGGATSSTVTRTVTVTTTTTTPVKADPPAKPVYVAYRPSFRFGAVSGKQVSYQQLRRYELLTSKAGAVLDYLGVERDRRSVVFLLAPNVIPAGSAKCSPSLARCTYLIVKPGAVVKLAVRSADGAISAYELRYLRVVRQTSTQAFKPAVSTRGQQVIRYARKLVPELSKMSYSASTGLLSIAVGHAVAALSQISASVASAPASTGSAQSSSG